MHESDLHEVAASLTRSCGNPTGSCVLAGPAPQIAFLISQPLPDLPATDTSPITIWLTGLIVGGLKRPVRGQAAGTIWFQGGDDDERTKQTP
jgi:hypothetical protein